MAEEIQTQEDVQEAVGSLGRKKTASTFSRIAKFASLRLVTLLVTVVIAVFLTIIIANMGGYVDQIRRAEIREAVVQEAINNPAIRELPLADRNAWVDEQVALAEEREGLNKPLMERNIAFLKKALTMRLGFAIRMNSVSGSRQVKNILLERLPSTLVLWLTANLLLFFINLFAALSLSRKYGSFIDKVIIALAPLNSAPGWFYGLFLIIIFASLIPIMPFGGMVSTPPPDAPLEYAISVLYHLILPIFALGISSSFLAIYNWRTFFLIYSSEDYVEMAKAKGLNDRAIERRYVLRPTLPTIITNFALLLIFTWTGAPIFETVFSWPGLGRTLFQAVGFFDVPVIVGSTVVFAYILALTVFTLDFIYALVDPRVKVGTGGGTTA